MKNLEKRQISHATGVLTLATMASRVAGLIRDMVVAAVFGAGLVTDAFFVAFTIPNLLRRFFAEGSLTAAFVPTFTDVLNIPAVAVRIPNPDNNIHAPNENLRLGNFREGIQTCLAILTEKF